eukprot:g17689.t1
MGDEFPPLAHAILEGSLARVNTLLAAGADVNEHGGEDGAGITPLHVAANEGQDAVASLLLEKGADKDALDFDGRTPLAWAVDEGHLAVAETLLAAGADINRRGHEHSGSPLHDAASSGHDEMVTLLLKEGAEKDATDEVGQTPLMWAVRAGHVAIVKTLVEGGVDVRAADRDGFTALHHCSTTTAERDEIASTLSQGGADKDAPDKDGVTPLMQAATAGHLAVVETLLAEGADPNIRRAVDGDAALHRACRHGDAEIVSVLLQKGADKNARENDGGTPLISAVCCGNLTVVKTLLTADVDLTVRQYHDGGSALHLAASRGHDEIVSALLEKGADKDALDEHHKTPLRLAASNKHLPVVETLVAAGADPNIRSRYVGYSVLDWASKMGQVGILRAILSAGRGDVDGRDRDGNTALHHAARRDQAGAIHVLLDAGADIELKASSCGETPLFAATSTSSREAMLALLDRGAAVNVRDARGDTPLHHVCRYHHRRRENEAFVDLLLTWGADETALTDSGESLTDLLDASLEDEAVGDDLDDIEDYGDDTDDEEEGDEEDEEDSDEYSNDSDDYDDEEYYDDAYRIYGDEPQVSPAEIERVLVQLARAPADRAWRRRSWLVMIYSRVSKARILGGERTGEDQSEESIREVVSVLGLEQNGDLTGVTTSLLRLELEGVFRTVVSFL